MIIRIKVSDLSVYLKMGLLLLVIKSLGGSSRILPIEQNFDTILSLLGTLFFIMNILSAKYPLKTLLQYVAIVLLGMYTSMQVGNVSIFITIATILAIRKERFDEVIRFIYLCEVGFLFVHTLYMIVYALFFSTNVLFTLVNGDMRFNFGFGHPNVAAIILVNLFFMWAWINYNNIRKKQLLAILLIEIATYLLTNSRTALLITIVFLLLLYFGKVVNGKHLLTRIGASFLFPVLGVIMWLLVIGYLNGNLISIAINQILTSRIKLGAFAVDRFGYSLFGQDLSHFSMVWDSAWGLNTFTFDNIYTYTMVNVGIVWLVLCAILFSKLAWNKNVKVNIFIIVWALYGITEVHGINSYLCFPILLVSLLFDRNFEDNIDNKIQPVLT